MSVPFSRRAIAPPVRRVGVWCALVLTVLAVSVIGVGPAAANEPGANPDRSSGVRFVMHEHVDHSTESYTFTSTSPLCASGAFADAVTVLSSNAEQTVFVWLVHTTYTCADGSGTFFAIKHLVRHQSADGAWNVGQVRYVGGTGAYRGLSGHGFDVGASANGLGDGTTVGRVHIAPVSSVWDAAADFQLAPQQMNPSPDSFGNPAVWSYQFGSTTDPNPATFQLLPSFAPNKFGVQGLESWWGDNASGNSLDRLPAVGINATGHPVDYMHIVWPPNTILVHPWWGERVIIGWRSPIAGNVLVTGSVSLPQQGNCGNGTSWSLDRDSSTVASGTISGIQTAAWSTRQHVSRGQHLYLEVDPRGDISCDSTLVHLTITQAQ